MAGNPNRPTDIVIFHDTVNRAALIEQIQQARDTLERQTCETAGKSGKQIERCVIATFQVAESRGTRGEFGQREELLRVGRLWLWRYSRFS